MTRREQSIIPAWAALLATFAFVGLCFYVGVTQYKSGDRDGRIQQRRLSRDNWRAYIDKRDEWWACASSTAGQSNKLQLAIQVKIACGNTPTEPR